MRILFLTQWFDPEPTFKGLLFARELQARGHEVTVLTGFPNYPTGRLYPGYRIRPLQRETIDGIEILRVPLYPNHDRSALKRVANYVSFAASSSLGMLLTRRPDVVYVYHPPATVGLPALVGKVLRGVPFVYDVQDLWPDTLRATGMLSNETILSGVQWWMNRVYKAAARVVVLSDGFRETIAARGTPRGKIDVIHNWADEAQLQFDEPPPGRKQELGLGDAFTVLFAGTMGPAQALDTVLEAAELLRDDPDVRLVLVGDGIDRARVAQEVESRALANVTMLPRRPMSEMGELLVLADALLVHLRDDPLFAVTVPSKTQAYLSAGRPILMGVRGDAAALVRDADAGLTFTPEDPAALADAVRTLRDLPPARRRQMGANGAAFYAERLSLSHAVRRFEQVLQDAALARPWPDAVRRSVDVVGSVVGLTVGAPVIAATAVAVRLGTGGRALFRQQRPGRYGEPFTMLKFRTMSDARDADGELLPDGERLTALGRFLRRSSLDELPELWNVLKGDMALVGPRPLLLRYTPFFTAEERRRLLVRPGITGLAQLNGRNAASWDARLGMDVEYVRTRSVRGDLAILARTVAAAVRGSGVVVDPESAMLNLDDERRQRRAAAAAEAS